MTNKNKNENVLVLKDKGRGRIWLTMRDGIVVGAMGSEPKRYMGLTLPLAEHLARYGSLSSRRKR